MSISLSQLQVLVEQFPDGKIYFDTPVRVKKTPHFEVFTAYGIWAHGVNGVWALDGKGVWHQLLDGQANVEYVIASLAQRVKLLWYGQKSTVQPEG